jgi:cyclopropane fatty-acyl-phospholipid synthase-like methyltransferase
MDKSRLTTPAYWEATYAGGDLEPLQVEGYRHFSSRKVVECIGGLIEERTRVLEIGAGNSAILTHLARHHGQRASFTGLDYSERGCAMLARRAQSEGVQVEIIQRDLFAEPPAELTRFDLVYSVGVVEHFEDLGAVLAAKRRFLAPRGRMLTIIPNMAGILGTLTRRYNRRVYDAHVPHTMRSFLQGHAAAGLQVRTSGYLCSSNFGVLSSCFAGTSDPGWTTYLWLTRLTKGLWFLESAIGELPHSQLLSPYLFAVAMLPAQPADAAGDRLH